jgi:hypothetical protein
VWFEPNGPGSNHRFQKLSVPLAEDCAKASLDAAHVEIRRENLSAPDVIENHDVDTLLALDGYHHSGRLAWHLYLSPL